MYDVLAHSIRTAKGIVLRFTEDLSPTEYLHRPTPKANCVAWLLGHLTLSNRSALKRIGVTDLPTLPDGFETRFGRGEEAPAASDFGDTSDLLRMCSESFDHLAAAVKKADAKVLNTRLEQPHPLFSTIGEAINFACFHSTIHAGQITIIRRSLGRPPLI